MSEQPQSSEGKTMIVAFRASDRMYGLKALGVYRKGIEAAIGATEKVYVSTLPLQTANSEADAAEAWVADRLDEMGSGEEREEEIPTSLALTLRTACSVYMTQLGKLAEKQADLLVSPEDTNVVLSHLQSLADRLNGQTELHGISSVTWASPGHEPVTISGEQFTRAAERVKDLAGQLKQ